jgi:putative two-component system response regulator
MAAHETLSWTFASFPAHLAAQGADFTQEGEHPPVVLIVDDRAISRQLLRAILKTENYRILEAPCTTDALEVLEREHVDLIVLDLMASGITSLEFCRRVKANRRTQLISVLMLTSVQGVENEVAGITSGADEFLIKPLHPTVVRTRVRALLRNKSVIDRLDEAESILFALAQSIEHRDPCTGGHCQRLAAYSVAVGTTQGVSRPQLRALYCAGFLHDIGKVGVPDAILYKSGKLDDTEWVTMRLHPLKGEEICRPMKSLQGVLPIIRSHHERWDGTGYPDGLRGEEIPLLARILQLADIYDALTTVRPYKKAYAPQQALEIMQEETRRGWRDPNLFACFLKSYENGFSQGLTAAEADPPPIDGMRASLENMRRELLR